MPQCGYSGTVVNILQSLSVPFETVDVLADERIRQGIKASELHILAGDMPRGVGLGVLCFSLRVFISVTQQVARVFYEAVMGG